MRCGVARRRERTRGVSLSHGSPIKDQTVWNDFYRLTIAST
jgi:hypothetical protein